MSRIRRNQKISSTQLWGVYTVGCCLVVVALVGLVANVVPRTGHNDDIPTYRMTGRVTRDLTTPRLAGSGERLYVDGERILTSARDSSNHLIFSVDTSNIKEGDEVEVQYTTSDSGSATLDCPSCYIKKIK